MPKYRVFWSKTYYCSGDVVVDAACSEEAEDLVYDELGDYEGSMQYNPDDDWVEASPLPEKYDA